MDRWKQYLALVGLVGGSLTAGWLGFRATGGGLPWAKRAESALLGGLQNSGGSLVDITRGIIIAGPIRQQGLVFAYIGLFLVFAIVGVWLYYRYGRQRESSTAERGGSRG